MSHVRENMVRPFKVRHSCERRELALSDTEAHSTAAIQNDRNYDNYHTLRTPLSSLVLQSKLSFVQRSTRAYRGARGQGTAEDKDNRYFYYCTLQCLGTHCHARSAVGAAIRAAPLWADARVIDLHMALRRLAQCKINPRPSVGVGED